MKAPIRLLIAEDSVTARTHLTLLMREASDFVVVGQAANAAEVVAGVEALQPDLVSLDVFLPGARACEIVAHIMAARPVPIVLVSSAPRTAPEVFEALGVGALDFVSKPKNGDTAGVARMFEVFRQLANWRSRTVPPTTTEQTEALKVVVISSSTGGPWALVNLLGVLPADFPAPIVVAQHIAEGFEVALAQWLRERTALDIRVATNGMPLAPGLVVIGPGEQDILVQRGGYLRLEPAAKRGYHPSGDLLLASAAEVYKAQVAALVLSGIGHDGTEGARAVASCGGMLLVQNKETSTIYGMPASVIEAGLNAVVGSPAELGRALIHRATWPIKGPY